MTGAAGLLLAIVVGAGAAAIVCALGIFVLFGLRQPGAYIIAGLVGWILTNFLVALIAAVTAGLVWHRFAMAKGWTQLWRYIVAAAVFGFALPAALLLTTTRGTIPVGAFASIATYGVVLGATTALFTWLIRRPDRDASPNPPTSSP